MSVKSSLETSPPGVGGGEESSPSPYTLLQGLLRELVRRLV